VLRANSDIQKQFSPLKVESCIINGKQFTRLNISLYTYVKYIYVHNGTLAQGSWHKIIEKITVADSGFRSLELFFGLGKPRTVSLKAICDRTGDI
jgi:hypothetical protein